MHSGTITSELLDCERELDRMLLTRAPPRGRAPDDFRRILDAIVETGKMVEGGEAWLKAEEIQSAAAVLAKFSTHFLWTVVKDAAIRLRGVELGSAGGWRRAVEIVKHVHYTVGSYGRASQAFVGPVDEICRAIAKGLWMEGVDEVEGGWDARNSYILGLLRAVGENMRRLGGENPRFYDFLCTPTRQAIDVIIQLLLQEQAVGRSGKTIPSAQPPPEHTASWRSEEKQPAAAKPGPPPALPSSPPRQRTSYRDGSDQAPQNACTDMRTFLTQLVQTLCDLSEGVDNPTSEFVSTGVESLYVIIHTAICSIEGADLAAQSDWIRVIRALDSVGQTAQDLAAWSVPLHKGLSQMFAVVARELSVPKSLVRAEPERREFFILVAFSGVGEGLAELMSNNQTFYSFLGARSEQKMRTLISLLTRCAPPG